MHWSISSCQFVIHPFKKKKKKPLDCKKLQAKAWGKVTFSQGSWEERTQIYIQPMDFSVYCLSFF